MYTQIASPLGTLTLSAKADALTGLWIEGQTYSPAALGTRKALSEVPLFLQVSRWLDAYFAGENPQIDFALAPVGTEFRQSVWAILRKIPYGQTTTYGAIARELGAKRGKPVSAQAVGGAVGHNPISILIPCHRVIGSDGSLTGYAGGLALKQKLLASEGSLPSPVFRPN